MLRKTRASACGRRRVHPASMRPQRNAAENQGQSLVRKVHEHASMRPQRNAAENDESVRLLREEISGFNEAAA